MKTPGKSASAKPDELLLKAAESGDIKAVRERLAVGANINAAAKNKCPAIFFAIRGENLELLRVLIDAGADLNFIAYPPGGSVKSTPLCYSINQKSREMAELLLKAGADLAVDAMPGVNPAGEASEQAARAYFTLTASDEEWLSSKERTPEVMAKARSDRDYWMQLVRDSIARGVQVRDYWLWYAVNHRDRELALLLISARVNPNAAPHGSSALVRAIEYGLEEIVFALIKAGADVNLKAGNVPLLVAAEKGHVSLIQALLDAGANINAIDDIRIDEPPEPSTVQKDAPKPRHPIKILAVAEGGSALIVATRMRHEAAVKLLAERGADVNIGDKHGITALAWATRKNLAGIIEILKNTGAKAPEFLEGSLAAAFWQAAKNGDAAKVEQLLSRGAKPDEMVKDREGEHIPLVSAARGGHQAVVQLLLRHGANPNACAQENWAAGVTSLMAAARTGQLEIVKALLAAKADVSAKDIGLDGGGDTALHYAARGGHAEVIKALLAGGASVNAKAKGGHTPLCVAASEKKYDAMKALLDGGADPNAGPSDGAGPLYSSAMGLEIAAVKLLLDRGANPFPKAKKPSFVPLETAASKGSVEIVNLLLTAGAPVNAQSHRGGSALETAALYGRADVIKILLAAGANPNVANSDGFTPLMAALRSKKEEIVQLLLDGVADPTAVLNDGRDVLKIAHEGKNEKIISLIEAAVKQKPAAKTPAKKAAPPRKEADEDEDEEEFEAPDFSEAAGSVEFQKIVRELEKLCGAKAEPLGDIEGGHSFEVKRTEAEKLLGSHHEPFLKRGAYLFRHDRGLDDAQDKMGLLPTREWTDLIRAFQTNGANYDLMPADIAKWLTKLSSEQPFIITGASWDWLEGRFTSPIKNARKLAHKLYEFCPDIVDQGAGTVKDLARLLEKDGYFFLWWD